MSNCRLLRRTVLNWIKEDFSTHTWRFVAEVLGMGLNLIAAMTMAVYSPNPPMFQVYILFLIASIFLISAAISRRSTGFTVLYIGFIIIDLVGFVNTL